MDFLPENGEDCRGSEEQDDEADPPKIPPNTRETTTETRLLVMQLERFRYFGCCV